MRFHNGQLLETQDVIDHFDILKKLSLYSHIDRVESPSPFVIDVFLSKEDHYFDLILAESSAKILPKNALEIENIERLPVGTGPYKVAVNNEKQLILEAFDNYFGFRPLVDRVEVWVIDEAHSSLVYPSLNQPDLPINNSDTDVSLDPGCTYVSINQRSGLGQSTDWQNYFASKLSSFNLFAKLPQESIIELGLLPAHGLKPGWYHAQTLQANKPTENATVTIAYHSEHPVFPTIAKAIATCLKKMVLVYSSIVMRPSQMIFQRSISG